MASLTPWSAAWVATEAFHAGIYLSLLVEGQIEDVEGAIDAGDYATACESATISLEGIAAMHHVLASAPFVTDEQGVLALLAAADDDVLRTTGSLPAVRHLTRDDADELLDLVRSAAAALHDALPFEVPKMRTPEGFFPTVRVASELSRLREKVGLAPVDWHFMRS